MSTRQIYAFAASGMVVMLTTGAAIYFLRGFPERQGLEYLNHNSKKEEAWRFTECNINASDDPQGITPCQIGNKNSIPSFLIWGDSHAPTYGKAIHSSASSTGVSGILTYSQGCPTLLHMTPNPQVGDIPCLAYHEMVLKYLEEHPEIKTVILASRWTIWIEETRYKQEEGAAPYLTDALNELPDSANGEELFTLGLERTIQTIKGMGRDIVIIAPAPEIGYDVPSANFIASRTGRDINQIIAPTIDEYLNRNKKTFAIFKSFEELYGIQIIEPWKLLCQDGICRAAIDGIPLYNDDDHLSVFASEMISDIFNPLFESMKESSQ